MLEHRRATYPLPPSPSTPPPPCALSTKTHENASLGGVPVLELDASLEARPRVELESHVLRPQRCTYEHIMT